MKQLLDSHTPSPNPSVVSNTSAATGTSNLASSIAPDDSVSQVSTSRLNPNHFVGFGLQPPRRGDLSREVSPAAPPLLSTPLFSMLSRDVSPGADSAVTVDESDERLAPGVDFKTLLEGIPKPWNVGPVSAPPPLPEPLYVAKLKSEILQLVELLKDKARFKQASKEEREKAKTATRPRVSNFRDQDQAHLKQTLEYMETLVATVYAFPDNDTCWTFALLANCWASKKLGRSYRLERDSEHCRLVCFVMIQCLTLLLTKTAA